MCIYFEQATMDIFSLASGLWQPSWPLSQCSLKKPGLIGQAINDIMLIREDEYKVEIH